MGGLAAETIFPLLPKFSFDLAPQLTLSPGVCPAAASVGRTAKPARNKNAASGGILRKRAA